MEETLQSEEQSSAPEESPGACPRCGEPAAWLPVDAGRRGRACHACGWVELPEIVVVRHNVNTVLRLFFPRSRIAHAIDFAILWGREWLQARVRRR